MSEDEKKEEKKQPLTKLDKINLAILRTLQRLVQSNVELTEEIRVLNENIDVIHGALNVVKTFFRKR